eukprot:TRINITY_DN131_c0_g1_i1.p2 TRINITY_DN131_c0_g1~~TRINITY_DN131_c0_g1_i1.p2  ORF type:complete len:197 (-),score=46.67 TRINITY_DN131_c0_g1_i1:475-999(-)
MLRSLVGSEMCIRDRYQRRVRGNRGRQHGVSHLPNLAAQLQHRHSVHVRAADQLAAQHLTHRRLRDKQPQPPRVHLTGAREGELRQDRARPSRVPPDQRLGAAWQTMLLDQELRALHQAQQGWTVLLSERPQASARHPWSRPLQVLTVAARHVCSYQEHRTWSGTLLSALTLRV